MEKCVKAEKVCDSALTVENVRKSMLKVEKVYLKL